MSERRFNARWQRWFVYSLGIILIVAALFRLWQIDSIPPGLFGDEAADGLDALDILAGRGQVFFPSNFGREGLHMWIVAASIKLLGVSPLAVRLPSALAGILTALATLWLGYEMFVNRPERSCQQASGEEAWLPARYLIPLAAAFYTSSSFWHVHFSRFGIRGVFTTTATAIALAALWRALNTRHWRWFAVSGFALGLGMHFYTASRFVPLMLAFFLGLWLLFSLFGVRLQARIDGVGHFLIGIGIMLAVATVIVAPLGYYFYTHPGSFTQRAGEVSAFQNGLTFSALQTIVHAAGANLLQFVVPGAGDLAQFYNLPGRAVFDILTATLAVFGVIISVKRWRDPVYSFLLIWFTVMILPSFIAVDRYPTLPRVLGVIPGIYFFPAIGLATLAGWTVIKLQTYPILSKIVPAGLVVLSLFVHAGLTFRDYFMVWGSSPATAEAFEVDMATAWRWLQANPPPQDVYLSSDLYKHPTFMFLHEQVPTTEYFTQKNPDLHWFDARWAWPLPADDTTTILIGDSAPVPKYIEELLAISQSPIAGGVLNRVTGYHMVSAQPLAVFANQLVLLDQFVLRPSTAPAQGVIVQLWHVQGPAPEPWNRLQLQSALQGTNEDQLVQASEPMHFLPSEWDEEGITLLTWQEVPWPEEREVVGTMLRVVPQDQPPLAPEKSVDGWITLPLKEGHVQFIESGSKPSSPN